MRESISVGFIYVLPDTFLLRRGLGFSVIYNFCGETKGKTSSALGTVMRALGNNKMVRIIFFMKHWQTGETEFLKKLSNVSFDVEFFQSGDKDFIWIDGVNHTTLKKAQNELEWGKVVEGDLSDIEQAKRGLWKAQKYLAEKPFLLVLDELNYAVTFGLIEIDEITSLLKEAKAQNTHVVITGRELHPELADLCDLITEMKKIKHPYDKGIHAVKGLDY